jgi:diguanylate cyclase (GGDEF)-like protein
MRLQEWIRDAFSVESDNPELLQSQLRALSRLMPLLYVILVANTVTVSATHHDLAPAVFTVWIPGILTLGSMLRVVSWWRLRNQALSIDVTQQKLRDTVRLTVGMGACFSAWALCLFPYGGPYEKGHVAFYMANTVIACIFCLMHHRAAALSLTLVVMLPFTAYFASTGNPVFLAIALNCILVTIAMVFVLLTHYRDFVSLIDAQKQLLRRHEETQRLSDENFRLANADSLTGLPNRRWFFNLLELSVKQARTSGRRFALGLVDLDGFKAVNDIYGHSAGDRLLVETGRRLREILPSSVSIARLGGDEFGIILHDESGEAGIMSAGRDICATLSAPYQLANITAEVTASSGFAVFPDAAATVEKLVEHADYALYHAKNAQRGTPVLFSHDTKTEMQELGVLDQRLRDARLEDEMWLAYQPIVDIRTEQTVCFEALARWTSPAVGAVPPDLFVRAAERSQIVNRMTEILLRKVLWEMQGWPEELRLSFNLSARNLASDETMLRIITLIRESGIKPRRIDLEITETALMADFENARDKLRTLRALGVGITLDDFGSGYSSLTYVHQLDLDKIKIDRGFVAGICEDAKSLKVIRTVIDLCRNLRLTCVAEGVESAEQVRALQDVGCELMQGYFVGRPMPADGIAEFLERERQRQCPAMPARFASP